MSVNGTVARRSESARLLAIREALRKEMRSRGLEPSEAALADAIRPRLTKGQTRCLEAAERIAARGERVSERAVAAELGLGRTTVSTPIAALRDVGAWRWAVKFRTPEAPGAKRLHRAGAVLRLLRGLDPTEAAAILDVARNALEIVRAALA